MRIVATWFRLGLIACLFALVAVCRAEPITLRFVVWDGDEALQILRGVARQFEKEHPNIRVKLENVAYNDYFTKLLAQYAAGVAPDVAMLNPDQFQNFAKRGALSVLDNFYDQIPGFNIKDYYGPIVKAHSWQGKLYVLPRDIAPIGLIYYNKRLFDEAGIPYPDGTWTWDFKVRPELKEKDFLWVLKQMTKYDTRGRVARYGLAPFFPGAVADLFVYSQGARYANNSESPTRVMFDDPRVLKAHEFLADIFLDKKKKWIASPTELSSVVQSTADQLFSSQKAAMYYCGIWDSIKFRRALVPGSKEFFDWDIAMVPAYAHGVRAHPSGGSGYAVMSSTPHPKEAWLLATYMAGAPGMLAMAKAGIAQPAIQKLALSPAWIPNDQTPIEERYPANRIITDTLVPSATFTPNASYWPELLQMLGAKQDAIWNGTLSAKEGLSQAQDLAQNRLNDILKQEKLPVLNWTGAAIFILGLIAALVGWVYWPSKQPTKVAYSKGETRAAYGFISPWLIGALVFTVGPMLVSLVMSATDWDIIQPARYRGLGNYGEIFGSDPRFWKSLAVSAIYTIVSVPCGIVVALALALLLNINVRGISLYRTCFYLPALASTVASSLVWRKIFQQEGGLINSVIYGANGDRNLFGLGSLMTQITGKTDPANWMGDERLALASFIIMSLWSVGGSMVILLAGLQGIPSFYYEAATLDGASPWQRFRTITFPLLTPSLYFVLITGVIGSFQVFTQVFVITAGAGSPNDATRVFMLHLYDNAFRNLRMGYASALAWILFLVILVFTLLQLLLNRKVYYEGEAR